MSGLDSLRDVAAELKRWRPPDQWKLRDAREKIEQRLGLGRWWTEGRRPGGRPSDFTRASDEGAIWHPAARDLLAPGDRLPRDRPGAGSAVRDVRRGVPASSGDQPRTVQKVLRKFERWFPELRWLFRRLDRLAMAGRPWLLRARRTLFKHRSKLIWSFVVGFSLMMPSS